MFTMSALPSVTDGIREIPRLPDLGPKPPPVPQEPVTSTTYRNLAVAASLRPMPLRSTRFLPLPSDDQVFEAVPNRWDFQFLDDYHRYANF